jgi:hypothetical protein
MAIRAAIIFPALVVLGEGGHLASVVANQAVLSALYRVRHRGHGFCFSSFVAQGTAIILPALVILGKVLLLIDTMAGQAVFPTLHRVRKRRYLVRWGAVDRGPHDQEQGK